MAGNAFPSGQKAAGVNVRMPTIPRVYRDFCIGNAAVMRVRGLALS